MLTGCVIVTNLEYSQAIRLLEINHTDTWQVLST